MWSPAAGSAAQQQAAVPASECLSFKPCGADTIIFGLLAEVKPPADLAALGSTCTCAQHVWLFLVINTGSTQTQADVSGSESHGKV